MRIGFASVRPFWYVVWCLPCAAALLLQTVTGYRVEVVTVRKLEFETDAFAFADKVRAALPSTASE